MDVFISYARSDVADIRQLRRDIERSSHGVWIDERLEGGQEWWREILERIASCSVFVFAASPDSIQSRACHAELTHAIALNRPILPVRIRDVDLQAAPDPLSSLQVIDYRERTPDVAIELTSAVHRLAVAVALPDPLPVPPPAPFRSFGPLRELVSAPTLTYDQQQAALGELRERAGNIDERATAMTMLRELRERPDIVETVARDIDGLLARASAHGAGGRSHRDSGEAADLFRSLVTQQRQCTPILGWGMSDSLVGPRQLVARSWAETFEFPMAAHQREDLPQVANFVAAMTTAATLRESLADFWSMRIRATYPNLAAVDDQTPLPDLIRSAWREHRRALEADPYDVLADLPCRIYVTAQPNGLLVDALRAHDKDPVVELCRWRPDVHTWPASAFEQESGYIPTPERPMVFHVFGSLDFPDSIVITEDEHLEFLASLAKNPDLVPPVVQDALADSALLLLGFRLEEWDIRVLLRGLVSQPGASRLQNYTHVAAQVNLGSQVMAPDRARGYLRRYFGRRQPSIDIYWGTVEEFAAGLAAAMAASR